MAIHTWKLQWKKGYARRYYKHHFHEPNTLQIAKYRGADSFDKHVGNNYEWHGKWYVNVWYPEKTWLFNTQREANDFAQNYMREH